MDDTVKRRDGTKYIGEIPAGTVITPELLIEMLERAPREGFDIELTATEPLKVLLPQHHAKPDEQETDRPN